MKKTEFRLSDNPSIVELRQTAELIADWSSETLQRSVEIIRKEELEEAELTDVLKFGFQSGIQTTLVLLINGNIRWRDGELN